MTVDPAVLNQTLRVTVNDEPLLCRDDAITILTGSGADAYESLANYFGIEDEEIDKRRDEI